MGGRGGPRAPTASRRCRVAAVASEPRARARPARAAQPVEARRAVGAPAVSRARPSVRPDTRAHRRTRRRAHDQETDARGPRDPREFFPVGLRAFLHEVYAVLHELLQGLNDDRVHVGHVAPRVEARVGEVQCCQASSPLSGGFGPWHASHRSSAVHEAHPPGARPRLYLPRGLDTKWRVQRRRWRRERWGGGSPPATADQSRQACRHGQRVLVLVTTAAFHDRARRPVTQPHTDRRIERKRFVRRRPRARR